MAVGGGFEMEFRLVYDGKLPAASQSDTRVKEKHEIRRVLGKPLAELWKTHPSLKRMMERSRTGNTVRTIISGPLQLPSGLIQYYDRCGRRFLPLNR